MRVSILIPCYNTERFVGEAVESALAQTVSDKEVIVVDDGSTDGSLAVLRGFGDRIRVETGPNRGGNVARNRLLAMAEGEWLQYLDADDYLLPDKIEKQLGHVGTDEADVIFSPWIMEHWSESGSRRVLLEIQEPRDPWMLLVRWWLPQTGGSLWRRSAVAAANGWDERLSSCQEYELYARLLMAGRVFRYGSEAGAVYRQWGEHTVWKRNKPETFRHRLEITDRVYDFLETHGQLTPARRHATNQGRFEAARLIWLHDRAFAAQIMGSVARSEPDFVPSGIAAPWAYRLAYRTLGFGGAQRLAALKRGMTRA